MKKILLCALTLFAMVLLPCIALWLVGAGWQVIAFLLLCVFALTVFFSLFSVNYAILMTDTRLLHATGSDAERWLLAQVASLAEAAGTPVPLLGILPMQGVNAYSVGWSASRSLVGVSEGVLLHADETAIRAMLARQIQFIANGDAAALTMMQAVMNACVFFWAQCARYVITMVGVKSVSVVDGVYTAFAFSLQGVGIGARFLVMLFTRFSIFRADAGLPEHVSPQAIMPLLSQLANQKASACLLPDTLAPLGFYPKGSTSVLLNWPPEITARTNGLSDSR